MADQSNEMGMVAKVAAALFEQEHADTPQASALHLQRLTLRKRYELKARAAIEAMREPTAEMKAAEGAHWDYSCHTCGGLAEGWHIMIDAALSHDEVKG